MMTPLTLEIMCFVICFLYVWSPYTLVFEPSYGVRQWNVVGMIYVLEGVALIADVFFGRKFRNVGVGFGFLPVLQKPSF